MIAITGGSGLVGEDICRKLDSLGLDFISISRDHKGITEKKHLSFDLSGSDDLYQRLDSPPELFIHLAAAVPGKNGISDSPALGIINSRIDQQIHNAVTVFNSKVIYFSTTSLYNLNELEFHNEDSAPLTKGSPYLASKLMGEEIFSKLNSTILRIPSPVSFFTHKNQNVLQHFLNLSKQGTDIPIWGSGKREQDFITADDISDAVLIATESTPVGLFNITSATPTTMTRLATEIVSVTQRGSIIFTDNLDPCEGELARFSNSKAETMLGWKPKHALHELISILYESGDPN